MRVELKVYSTICRTPIKIFKPSEQVLPKIAEIFKIAILLDKNKKI